MPPLLPIELVERILHDVYDLDSDSNRTLRSCCRVNKIWHALAEPLCYLHRPLLFHDAIPFDLAAMSTLAASLIHPRLFPLITAPVLSGPREPWLSTHLPHLAPQLVWLQLDVRDRVSAQGFASLRGCVHLERLGVQGDPEAPSALEDVLEVVQGLHRLDTLLLDSLTTHLPPIPAVPTFTLPPTLKALHLRRLTGLSVPTLLRQTFASPTVRLSALTTDALAVYVAPELALSHSATLERLSVQLHTAGPGFARLFRRVAYASSPLPFPLPPPPGFGAPLPLPPTLSAPPPPSPDQGPRGFPRLTHLKVGFTPLTPRAYLSHLFDFATYLSSAPGGAQFPALEEAAHVRAAPSQWDKGSAGRVLDSWARGGQGGISEHPAASEVLREEKREGESADETLRRVARRVVEWEVGETAREVETGWDGLGRMRAGEALSKGERAKAAAGR
ncbi:hypothetical protein JCM10207_004896 [Rhodosporidiobolus poonsookiae]